MNSRRQANGRFASIHGDKGSKLYGVWCGMKERCSNPNNKRYACYGGKGIRVCDEWNEYIPFKKWALENGYAPKLTIDRIDGNGDYSPENCRFVTTAEQNRNYSRNVKITFNGETLCLMDWANKLGINRSTLSLRLKSGMNIADAFQKIDRRKKEWKQAYSQH